MMLPLNFKLTGKLIEITGAMNIYQPVLRHNFAKAPDTHFARDTHMRIILGNSSSSPGGKNDKKNEEDSSKNKRLVFYFFYKNIEQSKNTMCEIFYHQFFFSSQKSKRNGIVTNPALRLVANVKNGLDSAAANLRKSTSSANPASKTNSFHWRRETPL